jgi:sugar phosphate isomerase/epimerase
MKTRLYALNIFIPGELKLVGSEVQEDSIMAYSKKVFERCARANVKLIVWGSAGARRIPDGFDRERAREQFISIARKLAMMAADYDIVLALENLNRTETNFINTLQEAYEIVREVDHPHLKLCADIYHMLVEHEPASVIAQTKGFLVHCDIAERKERGAPGASQEDFSAYLKELNRINYCGKIVIEARWKDLATEVKSAREYLQAQIDASYMK